MRKQNKARLHKGSGFLILLLIFLSGCTAVNNKTAYSLLTQYDCWWGCEDEDGATGFCCRYEVPERDLWIMDCKYAKDRIIYAKRTQETQSCP